MVLERDKQKTVDNLLNAEFPFYHPQFKRIYTKCRKFTGSKSIIELYQCNICHIKLLGEDHLLEHNWSIEHEADLAKHITEILNKSANDKTALAELTESTKKLVKKAAINTSKKRLDEAMADLKSRYDNYRKFPNFHPMYMKEWYVFYLRCLSNLISANKDPNSFDFAKHFCPYWKDRVQIYYQEDLKQTIDQIGANYESTLSSVTTTSNEIVRHHTQWASSSVATHNDENKSSQNNNGGDDDDSKSIDSDASTSPSENNGTDTHVTDMEISSLHSECRSNSQPQSVLVTDVQTDSDGDLMICIDVNSDMDSDDCFVSSLREPIVGEFLDPHIQWAKDSLHNPHPMNNRYSEPTSADLDLAVMKTVLLLLKERCIHPDTLSDDSLKDYIKIVIQNQSYLPNIKWATTKNIKCIQ